MTQDRGSNGCLLNHEPKIINYLLCLEGTQTRYSMQAKFKRKKCQLLNCDRTVMQPKSGIDKASTAALQLERPPGFYGHVSSGSLIKIHFSSVCTVQPLKRDIRYLVNDVAVPFHKITKISCLGQQFPFNKKGQSTMSGK